MSRRISSTTTKTERRPRSRKSGAAASMEYRKLFRYYEQQTFLPTYANLADDAALARYVHGREMLFSDKLFLPPRIFRDASMVEFGPDSGENALVFARWGARTTLVEPNERAHKYIRAYFERFGLSESLRDIVAADVEAFAAREHASRVLAEFVDAEGFIYTIQPADLWLGAFAQLLRPGGFAIVSYYEKDAGFFEIALKAIYAAAKTISGRDPVDTAWALYETKWNSIPHTRSFESWVMDVMENPFVRLKYFLDADALCNAAQRFGFSLYSSWPVYRAPLEIYWHKRVLPAEERRRRHSAHLARSHLSFMAGEELYLVGGLEQVDAANRAIAAAAQAMDQTVESPTASSIKLSLAAVEAVKAAVQTTSVLARNEQAPRNYIAVLEALKAALTALLNGDFVVLCRMMRESQALVEHWGTPTHFAVFRRQY